MTQTLSPTQSLQLSREEAAELLLRRRTARRSLIEFTRYTNAAYQAAPHHKLIAEKLEAAVRGDSDRVMLLMPPRHGKSELASRRLPAMYLGLQPSHAVIAASYNADLASDFGREVRNIVASARYQSLFGTRLAPDSRAANRWNTDKGGAYIAAGVGTSVTGRGADLLLIDDPLKDREEADSQLQRDKLWAWYTSTAYTRLAPGGRIVLIQTRWHEDDLAGRLLDAQRHKGDEWDVLELPAISPGGHALWPERYPLEALERYRAVMPLREWSALYQQKPAPDEGAFFKRDWFKWYDDKPKHLRIYGASDYAVTDGDGDFTVHLVAGTDPDDNLYVLDIWRGQTNSDQWVEHWLELVRENKPLLWAEENGQIVKSIGPFLDKRMRETKTWCRREQFFSVSDKPTRSRAIQARASMGKVYLPRGALWLTDFLSELLTFPAGKHDDQVDAFGLIGRMLDEMVLAHVPKDKPKGRVKDGYTRGSSGDEGSAYRTA